MRTQASAVRSEGSKLQEAVNTNKRTLAYFQNTPAGTANIWQLTVGTQKLIKSEGAQEVMQVAMALPMYAQVKSLPK